MPRLVALLLCACLAVALGATVPAGAQAPVEPDDPGRSRQWALDRIGAPAAWTIATGAGTTIAIVDSGVAGEHPDLVDKLDGAADCVGHDDAPGGCVPGRGSDDAGHGTHVAGIAAASSDNGRGIAGVAPGARLLSVRVLANSCPPEGDPGASTCEAEGTESDVAEGVRWAADRGADVINLSLGSVAQALVGPGESFADALDHAWSRGAIPVLVAGNDLLLPGSLVDVPAVVVSATDREDGRASYSNGVGSVRWGVAAPGGESDTADSCEAPQPNGILSTYWRPTGGGDGTAGYACVAGTSMAAPHVSGALAVLRSAGLSPADAVDRLLSTARDLGPPGPDSTFGAGRIDLGRAVAGLPPTGQPVRATGEGVPVEGGGGGGGEALPGPATTGAPSGDAGAATSSSSTSAPPRPTTTDARDDEAASPRVPRRPAAAAPGGDGGADPPAAAVVVAFLAVAGVAGGHLWRLRRLATPVR